MQDLYGIIIHSTIKESPFLPWSGIGTSIHSICPWRCQIEAICGSTTSKKQLTDHTETAYYLGTTATKTVIKYWNPKKSLIILYCVSANIFGFKSLLQDGSLSHGSLSSGSTLLMHNANESTDLTKPLPTITIETRHTDPFLHVEAKTYTVTLPACGQHLDFTPNRQNNNINILYCE